MSIGSRAALVALWLVGAPGLVPAGAAQEPSPVSGGAVSPTLDQETGRYAEADSIRASYVRPPGSHAADWVDVVEFPLKAIGYPLDVVLVKLPGWLVANVTAPRPPSFLVRAYRGMTGWGLKPTIRTTIGPRSGAAFEFLFSRYHPFYIHTAVSLRLSQRHRAGVLFAGGRSWLSAEVKWERQAESPFYGIGSSSEEVDRAFYRRDWADVSLQTGVAPLSGLALNAGIGYENDLLDDPVRGGAESIFDSTDFDTGLLFGAEERTEFVRYALRATLDLSRWRDFQQRGVLIGVTGAYYEGANGTDSQFHKITGVVQGYLPINGRQSLALRGVAEVTRDDEGNGATFFHLASLGGSRSALGFPTGRFRDRDMLALMSEWRYEIWRDIHSVTRAEGFVFLHDGTVAERLNELGDADWHPSYGFGMRLARPEGLIGVAYLGFSSEGVTAGIRGAWRY
jgi:hypothetical protein